MVLDGKNPSRQIRLMLFLLVEELDLNILIFNKSEAHVAYNVSATWGKISASAACSLARVILHVSYIMFHQSRSCLSCCKCKINTGVVHSQTFPALSPPTPVILNSTLPSCGVLDPDKPPGSSYIKAHFTPFFYYCYYQDI